MNKKVLTLKYSALILGSFLLVLLLVYKGEAAIRSIMGFAVAETSTLWNNLKDAAFGDNATNGVGAFSPYLFDGTNFDRARGDTTNGLDVDVTRVSGTVTIAGDVTPAETFANPTTAIATFTLNAGFNNSTWDRLRAQQADNLTVGILNVGNMGFDGTNWDRVRALANNADDVAVSTSGNLSTQSFEYEFDGTTYDRVRNQFTQTTASITTNAAGTPITMTSTPMSKFTMMVNRTAGTTDVVEIDLQCSITQVEFVQIATITDLTNEPVLVSIDGTPCAYIRYRVVTVGTDNTLTIDLLATR